MKFIFLLTDMGGDAKKSIEVLDKKKSNVSEKQLDKKVSQIDVSKKNFEKEQLDLKKNVWENEADKNKEVESHIVITDSHLWQLETKIEVEKWSDVLKKELQDSTEKNEILDDVEKLWESFEKANVEALALKVLEDPSKKIEQCDKVFVESFSIFVWWNVIGSLYKNLMMKSKSRSWSIDEVWFTKYLDFYPVKTVQDLEKSMLASETTLSESEKKVMKFLAGDSVFAKEYREQKFPDIAQTMRQSMPEFVSDYNRMHSEGEWISDKIKNSAGYLWDGAKWVFDKNEWEKNPTKVALWTAAVVGWAYLGYKTIKGIFDWFSWDPEEKKDPENEKKEKKQKKSFFSKMTGALKRWLPIAGGALLINWFLTGNWVGSIWDDLKNFFGIWEAQDPKKAAWTSSMPWGVEKTYDSQKELAEKNPEIQQKFSYLAEWVNQFYASIYGKKEWGSDDEMLGESDYEKDSIWTVPYMLNSRYATVGDMLSENAFFYEIVGSNSSLFFDSLKKMWFEWLKKLLMPLAEWVDSMSWWFIKSAQSLESLIDNLKGKQNAEEIIRMVFRKSLKVMGYLQTRKKTLSYILAQEYLKKNDTEFTRLSSEAQKEKILQSLQDEKFYSDNIQKQIEELFLNKKLLSWETGNLDGVIVTLEKYHLLDGELDELTKEIVQEVDENKKNILKDDGEENLIDKLSEKISQWKLEDADKKLSKDMVEKFHHHIKDVGARSFYSTVLSGVWQFINTEDASMEQILKAMNYEWSVRKYIDGSQEILAKIQNNSATSEDLKKLQELVDDYFMLEKEIKVGANQIVDIKQDNWNYIVRWGFGVLRSGTDLFNWIQMVIDGKRVKGWMTLAGGALTLDVLTAGTVLKWYPTKAALWTGNVILKPALMLTWNTAFTLWARLLPARFAAELYKDGTRLSYAVAHGEIDLDRALAIAQRNGLSFSSWANGKVATKLELLEALFPSSASSGVDYKKLEYLFEKCGNNKNIMQKIFAESGYVNYNWMSPRDWLKADKSKVLFRIKNENLEELYALIQKMDSADEVSQKFFKWVLLDISDGIQLKNIWDWIDSKYVEYFVENWIIKPEEFGRLIASYADQIDNFDDFQLFIDEMYKAGKINQKNGTAFFRNTMKDWKNVKNIWKNNGIKALDSLDLWLTKSEKILNVFWKGIDKAKFHFSQLLNSPKMPQTLKGSIQKSYQGLSQISPDVLNSQTLQASKNFKVFGDLSKLKNIDIVEMKKISTLLQTDKKIAQLLAKAKNVSEVEKILAQNGVNASRIDSFVLEKISKSWSTQKVMDWVFYAAESENLSKLQTVLKHPSAKMLGRVLMKVWVWADFIFAGLDFKDNLEKTQLMAEYNKERSEVMSSQTIFDLTVQSTGATAGLGALLLTGPAGWIAGWAAGLALWLKEVGDLYYDQLHEHYKNFQDFSHQSVAQTKQNIVALNAYDASIDPSWGAFLKWWIDKISGKTELEQKHTYQTVSDALRALIFIEETQKNPFSALDLNKFTKENDKELAQSISSAKNKRAEQVERRMKFFDRYKGKNLIDKQAIEKNTGLSQLDMLLEQSRDFALGIASGYELDGKFSYRDALRKKLHETDKEAFESLEKKRHTYPREFVAMIMWLKNYEELLEQNKDTHPQYQLMRKNLDFLNEYLKWCQTEKTFEQSLSLVHLQESAELIDYSQIEYFLEKWDMKKSPLEAENLQDQMKYFQKKSEKKLLNEYGVSESVWHTILLRVAKEIYSYSGEPDLKSLHEFFSERNALYHWIYYADGYWWVNDDFWLDEKICSDQWLNDLDQVRGLLDEIVWQAEKSDFISSHSAEIQLNIEVWKQIKNIFHEELRYREHPQTYIQQIKDYIVHHSYWKYIELPIDLVCLAGRVWFVGAGEMLYCWDGSKLLTTDDWKNSKNLIQF